MPTLTLNVLLHFSGPPNSGSTVQAGPLVDPNGDVIGATQQGGTDNGGMLYEIPWNGSSYAATPTVLYNFDSVTSGGSYSFPDGEFPNGLIEDSSGNLFGTTSFGGADGYGTVFELPWTGSGYASSPTILASFSPALDGALPEAGLVMDAAGDLFGTTSNGGADSDGTVFEIAKTPTGYSSTVQTLASFDGTHGSNPRDSLILDSNGDIFGTAPGGGAYGDGTVFEITNSTSGYSGTITTLASFNGTDGSGPAGGLVEDAYGDLFGTANGGTSGDGVIYELPFTELGYDGEIDDLITFDGTNGRSPNAQLLIDANGNLYGTSIGGGSSGDGNVFELPRASGLAYSTSLIQLAQFDGANGLYVSGGLASDAAGNLFGTTLGDGSDSFGTVYEITGSGFTPIVHHAVCYARGTRILTSLGEVAVEDLRAGMLIATRFGGLRKLRWLGRQSFDPRFIGAETAPIRFAAGTLGENQPCRDLVVSPGHALLLDDHLVPAEFLVNDVTITQPEPLGQVDYFHVDLGAHDCVLADGAWAESYAAQHNRGMFHNAGECRDAAEEYQQDCRPRIAGDADPALAPIRAALAQRLQAMAAAAGADLHLLADGARIEPSKLEADRVEFTVPGGWLSLLLVSRAARPSAFGSAADRRALGFCLFGVSFQSGAEILRFAADDAALGGGFHAAELGPDGQTWRWTKGRAELPNNLPFAAGAPVTLRLLGHCLPRYFTADAPRQQAA